jgi:hypothetical protein
MTVKADSYLGDDDGGQGLGQITDPQLCRQSFTLAALP